MLHSSKLVVSKDTQGSRIVGACCLLAKDLGVILWIAVFAIYFMNSCLNLPEQQFIFPNSFADLSSGQLRRLNLKSVPRYVINSSVVTLDAVVCDEV